MNPYDPRSNDSTRPEYLDDEDDDLSECPDTGTGDMENSRIHLPDEWEENRRNFSFDDFDGLIDSAQE